VEVKDGDTVLVRGSDRVRIVHRSEGTVRIVYNAANRWIAILCDFQDPSGPPSDGKVKGTLRFDDVDGMWPLGERWQGSAVIDEYEMAQGLFRVGMGITTEHGLVQLLSGSPGPAAGDVQWFQDPRAVAVVYYRGGTAVGTVSLTFDEAEQFVAQQAERAYAAREARKANPSQAGGFSTNVNLAAAPGPGGITMTPMANGPAPVRVGSTIVTPHKIVDAPPVYPPIAQSARVQGVVILEITVGVDGTVTGAKVLRSIPLLDQAALDCVQQWKYEPTQLNGGPVPVIMTVTVNFVLKDEQPDSPPSSSR
jgi:TonB family protein